MSTMSRNPCQNMYRRALGSPMSCTLAGSPLFIIFWGGYVITEVVGTLVIGGYSKSLVGGGPRIESRRLPFWHIIVTTFWRATKLADMLLKWRATKFGGICHIWWEFEMWSCGLAYNQGLGQGPIPFRPPI
jgi:hypothetical protein